jgi:HlyD family secretion protein
MNHTMKKILKISVLVIIGGLCIFVFIFLYNKSRTKPVVYQTKTPLMTNIIKKTVATGSIVPRKEIEIKPQVSGIVQEIYLQPGQDVKKGDLIAKVKIIPNMIQLNDAEARLKRAKLALDDEQVVYDRQKKIFDQGVIPEADFQKERLAFNTAKQEMETAENNLELIREGVIKGSGNATNTLIRSTIEGMVLSVPVEVGNSVIEANTFNAGTTIALVADMGEMIFKGKVDETEVGKIKNGMKLILTIGAIENTKYDAVLEYISPKGVAENGAIQFEIKAAVQLKKDQFIRSGYSATADIVLDRRDNVLALDEALIQFKNDSAFVEIKVDTMKFVKRYIKTGLSDGLNIEVLSGLKKTDKIKIVK